MKKTNLRTRTEPCNLLKTERLKAKYKQIEKKI